jgi:hypothetical protein
LTDDIRRVVPCTATAMTPVKRLTPLAVVGLVLRNRLRDV